MKVFKLGAIGLLFMTLSTGCASSTESPETVARIPIYNEQEKGIYDGISKMLVNSSLLIPSNSKEVGKINEVDLDNDGINEVIAFEKKKNAELESDEVGFIVLSQYTDNEDEVKYREVGTLLEEGSSIEYANFYDLDNDGYKEIVLLVKNSEKTNMYIYRYEDDEIKRIFKLNPTWIINKKNITNMKIKIGNIDGDSKLDILMLHFNQSDNKIYASLTNFDDDIVLKDFIEIENVKNLSDTYITIGNVGKSKTGIILDIPTYKENNYTTQILYIEDNKLKKAFNDLDENIMKAYYIPVSDINDDKVIDIPIVNGNGHAYTSKNSANINWYGWNGKNNEQSGLLFISQIYYNYQYNFKFLMPNNLLRKVSISQPYDGDNISFIFNYYDGITMEQKNLFEIKLISKTITEDTKSTTVQTGTIVGETEDYSFVIYLNDEEELKSLDITRDALVDYFSLIYE